MNTAHRMVSTLLLTEPRLSAQAVDELLLLTARELEILKHMASDLTDEEIGNLLCIEPKSVANCKNRMAAKLNQHGRRTLYRYAFRLQDWLRAV